MKTLVANWKMNLGLRDAVMLAKVAVGVMEAQALAPDVIIAPSMTALADVADAVQGSHIRVAAQDVSAYAEGAYTGQTSALQARDAGALAAIVGHSEARAHLGDTDERIGYKVEQLMVHRMDAIVCVGESKEVRDAGQAEAFVAEQLKTIFSVVSSPDAQKISIAYEPLWAIGSGVIPSVHDVEQMHKHIRATLSELDISGAKVLYGGSITPSNAVAFLQDPLIDGVLVGGASDDASDLAELIEIAADSE